MGYPTGLSTVENCYTDGLLANSAQTGEFTFTVRPPPSDGPVEVKLEARGSLDAELVVCAKRALGSIHHYPRTGGRVQGEVTATVRFDPLPVPSPELPTEAALRSVLDNRYGKDGVVRLTGVVVHSVHHRESSPDPVRDFYYTAELTFVTDGYEASCHHTGSYMVFSRSRTTRRAPAMSVRARRTRPAIGPRRSSRRISGGPMRAGRSDGRMRTIAAIAGAGVRRKPPLARSRCSLIMTTEAAVARCELMTKRASVSAVPAAASGT